MKNYLLDGNKIKPIATGRGACIASDEITVHGHRVGYMYRDSSSFRADSGWRFFAGDETQEYVDDPDNLAIYDINTIANYDPDIVEHLGAPVGSAFDRATTKEPLREITPDERASR